MPSFRRLNAGEVCPDSGARHGREHQRRSAPRADLGESLQRDAERGRSPEKSK